ncbi:flagellar FlbD family protein [Pectobacterium carotovorum]|uniref:Uncharacterized protein n=1 Tax=Pectobacterium carotovorum subsp. carotovorum TaxID=555 RepID=A0AAI9PFG7_PECCC|nr:flagellar FlbD family protein [Pectobacterium carotovorum]GKX48001.1 hypothetical protein SOASR016_27530 [Pectobacterium carotovorum subsp. carotovorum]GLV70445.1 hypothetical protein Pcaca03_28890 [Pectobacterium carotovorum subsp. carotovorum]
MRIIKLTMPCTVEKQGDYGWEPSIIYEPIYIVSEHIESLIPHGHTSIKMTSGEKITVQESVEDICYLLCASVFGSNELEERRRMHGGNE